jgi:hypothetical protein
MHNFQQFGFWLMAGMWTPTKRPPAINQINQLEPNGNPQPNPRTKPRVIHRLSSPPRSGFVQQSDAREPPPRASVSMLRIFRTLDSLPAPVSGGGR